MKDAETQTERSDVQAMKARMLREKQTSSLTQLNITGSKKQSSLSMVGGQNFRSTVKSFMQQGAQPPNTISSSLLNSGGSSLAQ